jgi:hypothetical protein
MGEGYLDHCPALGCLASQPPVREGWGRGESRHIEDSTGYVLADAVLPACLVLEGVALQPPSDIERITLLHVPGRCLGQTVPADDTVELGLLLALDGAIRGQAEARDSLAVLGVTKFGIASSVADQDDFVDAAHPSIIAIVCKTHVRIGYERSRAVP